MARSARMRNRCVNWPLLLALPVSLLPSFWLWYGMRWPLWAALLLPACVYAACMVLSIFGLRAVLGLAAGAHDRLEKERA